MSQQCCTVFYTVPLIVWISDALSQGYTVLQSLVKFYTIGIMSFMQTCKLCTIYFSPVPHQTEYTNSASRKGKFTSEHGRSHRLADRKLQK